ncbi:MAG TPA: hypothetical protein VMR37_04150, partial [Rhabdochlamydiaceae bacterium]|nr:hypothetical protein [Rhabdochlamydiaceae bacterium]
LKKTTDLEALRKPLFDLAKKLVAEAVDALTPKEKENVPIAAQAKAINPEIAKVNQALQEISIKLTQGALALDRKTIFQKYPGLEKTLAEMPEQKKQFEMILSRTWVKNALKNLSPYQGTPFEITILKSLGYNVSSYDDKKFLQEALETCFNTKNLPSIEELPKEFKKRAFDFRARLAGVPKEALGNLRALLRFYQAENLKLLEKALEARDGLKLQCRLPKAQDYIKGQFLSLTLVEIRQSLTQFIESRKEALRQGLTSGHQDFPSLSFKVRKELPQNLRGGDAWFYKYENMIIGEFAQGDNENECLTEGACLGLAYRLACAALKAPMDAILGIAVRSIKATDRLIQAYHNNTLAAILPKEVLAKRKQKEKLVFRAKGDTNVGVGLIEHLQKLEESNGGIMLCWDGHATFMRFDPKRNKFFFFDPNFNTIVFQKKHDESLEMLAIRMVTAYIGLYRWSYPTRGLMTAYQIVPLKADETVQTDLNKIPTYVD